MNSEIVLAQKTSRPDRATTRHESVGRARAGGDTDEIHDQVVTLPKVNDLVQRVNEDQPLGLAGRRPLKEIMREWPLQQPTQILLQTLFADTTSSTEQA
jgi:hypothetical protein